MASVLHVHIEEGLEGGRIMGAWRQEALRPALSSEGLLVWVTLLFAGWVLTELSWVHLFLSSYLCANPRGHMHLCSGGLGRSGEALVLLILLSGGMPGGGIQPLPVSCFPETLCHIQELRANTPLALRGVLLPGTSNPGGQGIWNLQSDRNFWPRA